MTSVFVFDIDGTLADTPAAIAGLIGDVVRDFGARPSRQDVLATVGKPLEASLAGLLGTGVHDAVTAEAAARYRRRFTDDLLSRGPRLLMPGVAEGLDRMRAAGHPLAVATSKIQASAYALLEATGILDKFDTVVCHDMVEHGKPHPDMALRVLSELGAHPSQSWYVGDTVTDMAMAHAAGLRTVAVSYGVDTAQALTAAGADHVAADFPTVTDLLLQPTGVLS
ncbi:HAD family hydrolase [Streptomyces arenae]|uniref:HAD family hydrolase n=1 Tax=Streptomyces arenae TaxID=29301 RepID=UPI00265A26D4|nr:HAD family hydrolase [Streptomyces arenae]MCG7205613.1 HAD family hydrolase [Streptomyces arenae]